jgi:hypothetical protein
MATVPAVLRLSEEAGAEAAHAIPGEPWMYGIGGFVFLLLLLLIVTRLNPDR